MIGFGDLSASAHCYPSLTTVAVDGGRVGREAVERQVPPDCVAAGTRA